MKTYTYFVGVDISAEFYTVSIYTNNTLTSVGEQFPNTNDGNALCKQWLFNHGATFENSVICLEATGVYGECFCYAFASYGFPVAVEPPMKVKRAFSQRIHKTDAVDSTQIAEYAFRFADELKLWQPKSEILEQIRTLLTAREHCVTQSAATQNILRSLTYKFVRTPTAITAFTNTLEQQKENIALIDAELKRLCQSDDSFHTMISLLKSIPGVGFILAVHLLSISNGFTRPLVARELSSFCGIAPLQHQSGTSVFRKPRSVGNGHPILRKLLFLAALSIRTHHQQSKKYFLRKVDEGKSKRLVINNLSNKLLKIICAVATSKQPFIENYRSVNPFFLKSA
jgi:transposase